MIPDCMKSRQESMFWRLLREALYDDLEPKPVNHPPVLVKPPLSASEIEEIRLRFAHGEHQKDLAREFRVSQPVISQHVQGVARLCGRGSGVRRVQAAGMAA